MSALSANLALAAPEMRPGQDSRMRRQHRPGVRTAGYFIWLFFDRTRSYSSSITPMNEVSLCQNGG